MKLTRTVTAALLASTLLAAPAEAGWKMRILKGAAIGVGGYLLGKAAANAAESNDEALPTIAPGPAIVPVQVPYPNETGIMDRIGELQEAVELIEDIQNADEVIENAVEVTSQLYSQAGLEMACWHHRSYNEVKWAGAALTGFTQEPRERYGQYLNCCVSDGPRLSAIAGGLAFFLGGDPLDDLRGLGNTVDLVLDGVNAAYTEEAWAEIRDDILSASRLQRSAITSVCQPLVSGAFADWQRGAPPPQPSLE